MSLIVHNNPRAPARRAVAGSRDFIRASLETAKAENSTRLRIRTENRQSAGTSLIDLEAADRLIDFVREHLVMQAAIVKLTQAPSPPRMAMQLLL